MKLLLWLLLALLILNIVLAGSLQIAATDATFDKYDSVKAVDIVLKVPTKTVPKDVAAVTYQAKDNPISASQLLSNLAKRTPVKSLVDLQDQMLVDS